MVDIFCEDSLDSLSLVCVIHNNESARYYNVKVLAKFLCPYPKTVCPFFATELLKPALENQNKLRKKEYGLLGENDPINLILDIASSVHCEIFFVWSTKGFWEFH